MHCLQALVQHDRLHLVFHGIRLGNALLCMSEGICTMSKGKLLTTYSSLCAFAADKAETCGHRPVMYNFSCSLAHANLCV